MERAGPGCTGRSGPSARARRLPRRGAPARRVPARPALRRGPPAPHVSRGRGQGHGLPRGLRRRGTRPARAARRDRRAPLAPGGEPPVPPRRRALRRRRARRLLPLARRRGGARRAQEGSRGPPDSVGQLDARLGAAPPRADLRGRRARAPRGRRLPARPRSRHASAVRVRSRADGARLHFSPPRELAIVGPVDSPVARAALEPFRPDTVVAVGPSDDVPLLAGKSLVDGNPAVYVCERFACQAPITSYEGFTGL